MKRLLLLVPCLALLAGCGDSPGGGDITDQDYFPFAVPDSWQYQRTGQVDTLGVTYSFSGNHVLTVSAVTDQGGWDLVELGGAGSDTLFGEGVDSIVVPLAGLSYVGMDDSGVWAYSDSTLSDSTIIAQFPLVVGATWTAHADPEAIAEVISMDASATVPDGTFEDVLHIRITMEDVVGQMVTDYWFAPGVGNVETGIVVTAGSVVLYEMTEELVEHFVI